VSEFICKLLGHRHALLEAYHQYSECRYKALAFLFCKRCHKVSEKRFLKRDDTYWSYTDKQIDVTKITDVQYHWSDWL
jgi:hypothetical protein